MTENEFFLKNVFFTTRQFAFLVGGRRLDVTSRYLRKLYTGKGLIAVTRGVWAQPQHPFFSPYGAVPFLLGNEQGYVSFLTALHRHSVISQIPSVIQIATTGHGRKLVSEIGVFEFFQMRAPLMHEGFEAFRGKVQYNLATPEKALLDTLYISTRRGRRFVRLPELESDGFEMKNIKRLLRLWSPPMQNLIRAKLALYGFENLP